MNQEQRMAQQERTMKKMSLALLALALSCCVFAETDKSDMLAQKAGKLWLTATLSSDDGYTWTLTSRIGNMLQMAEDLFGPRDRTWTILGAEMRMDDTQPQNWYPGFPKRKDIIFQIGPSAAQGDEFACYQLAHEVVHSLAPKPRVRALVIEEGVAAWFAKYYVKRALGKDMHASTEKYQKAEDAVGALLARDPAAIRKLREVEPCFKSMTAETFRAAKVQVSDAEVKTLLAPF